MAIDPINVGNSSNDGTGDSPRAAFIKVNANEADLDTRVDGTQSDITTHKAASTSVHGIANTSALVVTTDARLTDQRVPTDASVTDAKVAANAAINPAKVAGTAVVDADARLSNARAPTLHASSHAVGGSDVLTPAAVGAVPSAEKGAPGGVATLDAGGLHLPGQFNPDALKDPANYISSLVAPLVIPQLRTAARLPRMYGPASAPQTGQTPKTRGIFEYAYSLTNVSSFSADQPEFHAAYKIHTDGGMLFAIGLDDENYWWVNLASSGTSTVNMRVGGVNTVLESFGGWQASPFRETYHTMRLQFCRQPSNVSPALWGSVLPGGGSARILPTGGLAYVENITQANWFAFSRNGLRTNIHHTVCFADTIGTLP